MSNSGIKWGKAIKHSAAPALLIHCSIGSVYCWSLLKADIAQTIGKSTSLVEWAFSLAIFFLGMSAAFFGEMVEKDVKKSSLISTICFVSGMALTGLSVHLKSLIGIYLSYGVLMGIGLGIGYLSPVKTLMLWFEEKKGLATGLAITGFGLAKVIASPLILKLNASYGVVNTFYILAALYSVMMLIAVVLIKKPDGWVEDHEKHGVAPLSIFKERNFIGVWLMLFINISCGLALISQEKDILKFIGAGATTIGLVSSLTAVFNAGGRLIYSAISDKLKQRSMIYKFMLEVSVVAIVLALVTNSINAGNVLIVIILLCAINASYGGGFSNLPTLLSDYFGMDQISQIHGMSLSAWAFAGLAGNQLSSFIYSHTKSYNNVLYAVLALYIVAILVGTFVLKTPKQETAK